MAHEQDDLMRILPGIAASRKRRGRSPVVFGGSTAVPTRTPSPYTVQQVHSGHSLTDIAVADEPWPGTYNMLIEEISGGTFIRDNTFDPSTVPGSPLYWRRLNEQGTPPAWDDMGNYDLGVITESNYCEPESLFPDRNDPDDLNGRIKQREEIALWYDRVLTLGGGGAGGEFLWYTHWPDWDPAAGEFDPSPTWRDRLAANEPDWLDRADYAMAQHGGYIYVIPGLALMMRLYDDAEAGLIPDILDGADFLTAGNKWWADTVHPHGLGTLAFMYLHALCVHHVDPRGQSHTWTNGSGATLPSGGAATAAEAQYIQDTVYDLCINYPRSGVPTLP